MRERGRAHKYIFGLILLLISLLTFISLISFQASDLSGAETVRNWMGLTGAFWSRLLIQGLGLGSWLSVFSFFVWGLLFFQMRPLGEKIRTALIVLFLPFLFSVFFSLLFSGADPAGSGGLTGTLISKSGSKIIGSIGLYIVDGFLIILGFLLLFRFDPSAMIHRAKLAREKKEARKQEGMERALRERDKSGKPPILQRVRYTDSGDPEIEGEEEDFSDEQTETVYSDEDEDIEPVRSEQENVRSASARQKRGKETESSLKKLKLKSGGRKRFPPFSLLHVSEKIDKVRLNQDIRETSKALEEVLAEFGVDAKVVHTEVGPVITRYELKLAPGIRVSKVVGLSNNIALSLAAERVRIVAPIPGKAAVGIEIPNSERHLVTLGDLMTRRKVSGLKLMDFYLGLDISGNAVVMNLKEAPHLLIAGATGAGKSVCLSTVICSFLYTCPSDDVRFIFVDPKMVELKIYNGIEHLLTEVITNPKKASTALKWLVREMERRYQLMDKYNSRDISRYNVKVADSGDPEAEKMPYIVLIVDELADLMMVAAKDVEESIARLAQKARAVGIHLILATQRPSVDVITGVIKANFPSRVAFQVASKIDSRTILDQNGADQLLGKGDLLFSFAGSSSLVRVQGAYVSDEEVLQVVRYLKNYAEPRYLEEITKEEVAEGTMFDSEDSVYLQAVDIIRATRKASASFLQRKLKIGYNRAARYIELMEEQGIVGPPNGSKPREVYLDV